MPSTKHDIPVRAARDRLIDLLAIGDTFPLTDLNVVADQLKVAYGGTAKIPIENAQAGMSYQLCDPRGQPLGPAYRADGNDDTLVIETPPVNDDLTYRIQVEKAPTPGAKLPPQGPRFLDEVAPVKVGIDTALVIEILGAPLLDPAKSNPQPADPRLVPYGSSVDVRVGKSQEGVEYWLILDGQEPKDVVRMGDLGPLVLPTGPVLEDIVIQVRASKTFLLSENRVPETVALDAKLYLKVMANPALVVAVDPAPIVDHRQDTAIRIAATQKSSSYRLFTRAIADGDYVRGVSSDPDLVTVAVPGRPDVQVSRPAPAQPWRTPAGWRAVGDALAGTGGDLVLSASALTDDALFLVQASKDHRVDLGNPASPLITSAVALDQAVAALVRPDAERSLRLRVPLLDAKTGDSMQVSDGQRGVYYHFRPLAAKAEFDLPAYFHKRDADDARRNKGVGQLGLEVDFAIATDPEVEPPTAPGSPFPRAPVLDIAAFAADDSLEVRAVKAQTLVETTLSRQALVAAVPAITAEKDLVDHGTSATLQIRSSDPLDSYQLLLAGEPVGEALAGDGNDLALVSAALLADARFEVRVTRQADKGLPVERVVGVPVRVGPDAGLAATLRRDAVPAGSGTEVLVAASQIGVRYQLLVGQTPVGAAVAGDGAEIALPTGAIAADTVFGIQATRLDDDQVAVMLTAQPALKIEPAA